MQRERRKLAAIVAADVVGYSRLIGVDEEATIQALRSHRLEFIDPAILEHGGRIANTAGDSLLLEFASAVDAVRFSIAFQKGIALRNTDVAKDKQVNFRVGINVGDVVVQGDDLLGDGVNIAARLESQSEPGGILMSDNAYRQVRNHFKFDFVDGGARKLKNIKEPVSVWSWTKGKAAAKVALASGTFEAATSPKLPDKPSIVVLPFTNMSQDSDQDYFSDGISEDLITDLSKLSGLFVIARNSAFSYKGKPVKIPDICSELGVQFALEGSVRRAGSRIRISAQLIDGLSGGHIWAERYDRQDTDIFEVQDDVREKIVAVLQVKLNAADRSRVTAENTSSVIAHDYFLKGRGLMFGLQRDLGVFAEAKDCFKKAVEIDPEYASAYAGLGMVSLLEYQNQWKAAPDELLHGAEELVAEAISRDESDFFAHYVNAIVAMLKKDHERWASAITRSLTLHPNFAPAVNMRGVLLIYTGEPQKAVVDIETAMRLDPAFQSQYLHFLGTAYFIAGEYETATVCFRRRISFDPTTDLSRSFLASALGRLGRVDEARQIWNELREINPGYSQSVHLARLPFRHISDLKPFTDGLRQAGLAG